MSSGSRAVEEQIRLAASLLRSGKLVAFPTETVYGLGANALDADAVARIFEAKGRPSSSPVIVHVSNMAMAQTVAAEWPEEAAVLARAFWPGPLTLVLTKQPAVPSIVTAGLPTVGVRMPDHPVALALIEAAQVPVAAPSANRFSMLSPTTAEHVRRSLGDRVDYVLDGGPCTVGIESTVLSLTGDEPVLLRPGGISRSQIEDLIGPIGRLTEAPAHAHPSPGMHPQHYSPRTKLVLVSGGEVPRSGGGAYLQLHHRPQGEVMEIVHMPTDAVGYAVQLYRVLHDLDALDYDWIAVDSPESTPEWEAVLDRLKRAAHRAPESTRK
ncbi:MAG: L-threonylcarbamoyladenylate synthase [Candidatus Korobacteraceae bacterium]